MTSNTPPPADHSALFSDPAELAREWDSEADKHWVGACSCADENKCGLRYLAASDKAASARRMAARGEQVPEF